MSWHTTTMSCYTIPCRAIWYDTLQCYARPWHGISYYAMPRHATPRHATPRHTTPYHTILYHTFPCHTILLFKYMYVTLQCANSNVMCISPWIWWQLFQHPGICRLDRNSVDFISIKKQVWSSQYKFHRLTGLFFRLYLYWAIFTPTTVLLHLQYLNFLR